MKTCVVLSSYNGEKYILEQLHSISNQIQKVDAVFISDDCSTDNTIKIVRSYIESNSLSNWHIKRNEINLGWKKNFCNLILGVPNEYDIIFLCDQDDIWYKTKTKEMLDCFVNDENLKLLISDAKIVYQDETANKLKFKKIFTDNQGYVNISPNNTHLKRPGCSFAVKRKFAQECFGTYFHPSFSHDGLLWLYAYGKNSIKYIKKELFVFRRLASSSTYLNKRENRYLHKKNECLERLELLKTLSNMSDISEKAKNMFQNAIKLETLRISFFDSHSFYQWLLCIKYINYYPNVKNWFGDLFFTMTYKQ